jgi:hypothetical protein
MPRGMSVRVRRGDAGDANSSGHHDEAAGTVPNSCTFGGAERVGSMRRFVAGLLLGLASMYWYAYQKDTFFQAVSDWFAEASKDPNAKDNLDKMISKRR